MKKIKSVQETLAQAAELKHHNDDDETAKKMAGTVAGGIWEDIKNLRIDMFTLPNQVVSLHCRPVNVDPSKLYVVIKTSSVLPALESAIGAKFKVELVDRFVTVERA